MQNIERDKNRSVADLIRQEIDIYRTWRCHEDKVFSIWFMALQRWQVEQLALRHAQFLKDPRYAPVTRFFLDDMYGLDLRRMADEVERALPLASHIMPDVVLRTAAVALELNSRTGLLDQRMTEIIFEEGGASTITMENYADAYRRASTREERHLQMALLNELGNGLDRYVRSRVIYATFRFARRPAHVAGLGGLYDFLDRGFSAMKPMGSAGEYINVFTGAEHNVVDNLFDQKPDPFQIFVPALSLSESGAIQ
ncbi:MAG: FFLEELY motif protein [Moraxellaceae bacterium]